MIGPPRSRRSPPTTQNLRSDRLDDAIADHPRRKKGARGRERPAEYLVEEDGKRNDEPDVSGGEEEEASSRKSVDGIGFRQDRSQWRFLRGSADVLVQQDCHGYERNGDATCHREQRRVVAQPGEQRRTEKEADPLEGILGSGEHGDESKQGVVTVTGDVLHGTLRAHLGEVFGDTRQRLGAHDVRHRHPFDPGR